MSNVEKQWTIMVYMAGDNNLSEDMITGLKGMKGLRGNKDINLIALYDSNYPRVPVKTYNFSLDFQSSSREPKLEEFETDLFDSVKPMLSRKEFFKIKDFVPKVVEKFPAEKYALILSGHSDGILGKTLLRDENPSVVLDLKKLQDILYDSRPAGSDLIKKRFDLLGFDGCLMNMVEVGYELKSVAKVMVGSQGNIPTSGWAYEKVLEDLVANPKMDEKEFAVSIVKKYADFNADYGISGRSVNISACNLDNVKTLSNRIFAFAEYLYDLLSLPTEITDKDDELTKVEKRENLIIREHFIDCVLLSHYKSQTFMHNQAVDLLDFISNLLLQSIKKLVEIKKLYEPDSKAKANFNNSVVSKILIHTENIHTLLSKIEKVVDGEKNDSPITELTANASSSNAGGKNDTRFILASCTTGSEYQFSKGTSIFFPWTDTALEMLYNKYAKLKFNKNKIWLKLLEKRISLTLRGQKDKSFTVNFKKLLDLDFSTYPTLAHKEHIGKEHIGKGDLESFYLYFSQIRNYDSEFVEKKCK